MRVFGFSPSDQLALPYSRAAQKSGRMFFGLEGLRTRAPALEDYSANDQGQQPVHEPGLALHVGFDSDSGRRLSSTKSIEAVDKQRRRIEFLMHRKRGLRAEPAIQ